MLGTLVPQRDRLPRWFGEMDRGMDALMREFFLPEEATGKERTEFRPMADMVETDKAFEVTVDLPGVKPEDMKISVEGNVLTITGTKEQVTDEKAERVHRYERMYGAFERTFNVPATVDVGAIKATYELGLLTLVLPKVEKAKPRQIQVEVANG